MVARRGPTALMIAASLACGPGEAAGTVAGRALEVADGWVFQQTWQGTTEAIILLSDTEGSCGRMARGALRKGETILAMSVTEIVRDVAQAPRPGTFHIIPPGRLPYENAAFAQWMPLRADGCESGLEDAAARAVAGTIELERYDPSTGAAGSFRLEWSSGERLEGRFDVETCAGMTPSDGALSACE